MDGGNPESKVYTEFLSPNSVKPRIEFLSPTHTWFQYLVCCEKGEERRNSEEGSKDFGEGTEGDNSSGVAPSHRRKEEGISAERLEHSGP